MSDPNTNLSTKTIIIAVVVVLIFSFAILLSQKKANPVNPKPSATPAAIKPTAKPIVSPGAAPLALPEPPKVRYVSGVIKKVNSSSIIVSDVATGKETEFGFDKTTKILTGEGMGKDAAISDLASDWNVAVFLPEDKNNNIAQIIHLVIKNPAK